MSSQALMANIFIDIDLGYPLMPYVGAGVGVSLMETNSTLSVAGFTGSSEVSEINFAWNLKAGLRYVFTESFIVELGYQYASLGPVTWDLANNVQLEADNITVNSLHGGITWQFN